jgi:hypothetical protein
MVTNYYCPIENEFASALFLASLPGPNLLSKSVHMMRGSHEFDWPRFWLQEVVILSVPTLIMIIASRGDDPPLSKSKLVLLLVVFVVFTALNRVLSKSSSR